ncbi:hypothetical protein FQA39_LY12908 [Lamprigera yunnana]|nr:hypothetical protein FQA39_LY12908 [Lamprigera yunnana]
MTNEAANRYLFELEDEERMTVIYKQFLQEVYIHIKNFMNHNLIEFIFNDALQEDKTAFNQNFDNEKYYQYEFNKLSLEIQKTLKSKYALASYQLLKEIGNYFKVQPKIEFALVMTTRDIVKTMIKVDERLQTMLIQLLLMRLIFLKLETSTNIINNLLTMATIRTGQPVIAYDTHKVTGIASLEMINVEGKELLALLDNKNIITIIGEEVKEEYAVSNDTKRMTTVYLNFTPQIMRAQQKQLNISNAYLQRYTKPLSPELSRLADSDFLTLLNDYKILANSSAVKVIKTPIVKEFLGIEISFAEIEKLFLYLDFKVELNTNDELIFTIDKNRTDIVGENDLCEEIARLYGYDNIQEKPPIMTAKTSSKHLQNKLQTNITKYLIGKAIYNSTVGNKQLSLFEIGDVYNLDGLRQRQLGILTNVSDQYEYIKGILDSILDLHQIDSTDIEIKTNSKLLMKFTCTLMFEMENKIENVYMIELNLDELYKLANLNIVAQEISKFQMSTRDITIEIPKDMQYAQIVSSLKKDVNNLIKISFVSSYEDEELKSSNKTAITIQAEFNNLDHQLTEKEILASYDQILSNINQLALRVR